MRSVVALSLAAVLLASSSAFAQEEGAKSGAMHAPGGLYDTSEIIRPQMLSVFAALPYAYGFGFGGSVRYMLPLSHSGAIAEINESFALELGGDFVHSSYNVLGFGFSYNAVTIPVEGLWSFHFTEKFTAYAKLALGWTLVFGSSTTGLGGFGTVSSYNGGFHFNFATGVLYKLSDAIYLRGELGYWGLKAGVGFAF